MAALLFALLTLAAPIARGESAISAASGGQRAGARLDLLVKIPEVLSLRLLESAAMLHVSQEDVARGFTLTTVGVEVTSNARSGFQLQLHTDPRVSTEGLVEGPGVHVPIAGADAAVRLSHHGLANKKQVYALKVRLALAPGIRPGQYAMPVRLSVSA